MEYIVLVAKYIINEIDKLSPCDKLVIFAGVMGSGKDFQCSLLESRRYTKIAFADPLREMAWKILGWAPKNNEEYEVFKKNTIGHLGLLTFTGREFLQNLGQTMREIDPDFWCKLWQVKVDKLLKEGGKVCCSDARFFNELSYASNCFCPSAFVFCDYVSERYDATNKHISEELSQYLKSTGLEDLDLMDHRVLIDLVNRYVP